MKNYLESSTNNDFITKSYGAYYVALTGFDRVINEFKSKNEQYSDHFYACCRCFYIGNVVNKLINKSGNYFNEVLDLLVMNYNTTLFENDLNNIQISSIGKQGIGNLLCEEATNAVFYMDLMLRNYNK